MVDTALPKRGKPNPGNPHPLWMFMAAISGVDDECERVRLTATGLSSLVPCRLSGVALVDAKGTAWRLIVVRDGQRVDSRRTDRICAELEPVFQDALRRPSVLIATADGEVDDARIPPVP